MASGPSNELQQEENLEGPNNGIRNEMTSRNSSQNIQQPRHDQHLSITPAGPSQAQTNNSEVKQAWRKENILCFGKTVYSPPRTQKKIFFKNLKNLFTT